MSLDALSRYDDAEDEIKDEDHDLVLKTKQSLEALKPSSRPSSRQSSDIESGGNKPTKSLVSYFGGDYSDDDDSDTGSDDNYSISSKLTLLHDGSNQVSSVEGGSPGDDLGDSVESNKEESSDGIRLPPEPEGRCSKLLQEKIAKMIEKKNTGMNVNEYVQRKKAFRNPSIYEKLISYIGINEHGTNFPKHIYDPDVWGPESYYEALAKTQKEYNDKKEKEKKESKRSQVEFVTGTKKPPTSTTTTVSASSTSGVPEKKSKWDQGPGKK